MKTLLKILLLIAPTFSVMEQEGEKPDWHYDIEEAKQLARKEHKMVMLSFAGSDWCKPCIKFTREVFEQPSFIDYANDHLVLVLADFPRLKKNKLDKDQITKNEKLASEYNNSGAFPLVVLMDYNGRVIKKTGYQEGGAAHFISFLEKALNE